MAENFRGTLESLFKGMDSFLTTKTVVGDAITVGDTIILPLVDVSFGVAASAKAEDRKNSGGGGMGGRISPSAVLVISNGTTKLVNVKNQDGVTKVLDLINRFAPGRSVGQEKKSAQEQKVDEAIHDAAEEKEDF